MSPTPSPTVLLVGGGIGGMAAALALARLGVSIDLLESATDADYAPNLQSFVDKGCNVIVTVGFLLADATKAAAEANPGVQFAIVDSKRF